MPNDPRLTVRDAEPGDVPGLARLLAQLGYPAAEEAVRARLAHVQSRGDRVLVAVSAASDDDGDGDLVGYASVHVTPVVHRPADVGRITGLVVREDARGLGVGRELVAAAERIARERGCERIEVTSGGQRAGAHAFYQRLGYGDAGRRFAKALDGSARSHA